MAAVVSSAMIAVALVAPEPHPAPAPVLAVPLATSETDVCGFPGALASSITADRPRDAPEPAFETWPVDRAGDGAVGQIYVTDEVVVVARAAATGATALISYDRATGAYASTIEIDVRPDPMMEGHDNGPLEIASDGTIYAIDSYEGRRAVVSFDRNGEPRGSFDIPESDLTTGHPLELSGMTWLPDYEGSPALVVSEGESLLHLFRTDGEVLGVVDDAPAQVLGRVGSSSVAGVSGGQELAQLRVTDLSTHVDSFFAPFAPAEEPSTPSPLRLQSLVTGPGDEGFLAASAEGVEWLDADGLRVGRWPNGAAGLDIWEWGDLAEADGRYWVLGSGEDGPAVTALSGDEMRAALALPTTLTAAEEGRLTRLGIGIGLSTTAPFNHFDADAGPVVSLRAEDGWAELGGSDLVATYTVTGDPLSARPVVQEARLAAVPLGGGEVVLEVPTLPGAYEVSAWLTREGDEQPVSATCLRYSVGAPGLELDLEGLSPGDDWGGPAPLRGVELASRLGTGSHRIQLDFGALIAYPSRQPDPSAVNWAALPGAEGEAPETAFGEIARAAAAAEEADIDLIVQVGQGGDAERAAVDARTWEGWVEVLAAGFARYAPQITLWSPWNEPNNTFGSGAEYAQQVSAPFARGVRRADPAARVIEGNTLGFAVDWWAQAVPAGICSSADALAVHPYTGWNRSWEQEGFTLSGAGFGQLRHTVGAECGDLPIWDTESGWTADGSFANWAQAANIARKLLWYKKDDIAGWTYFFTEGGWGESGLSWSLIQYRSFVKPGGLAFAAVSRLLAGYEAAAPMDTGIPLAHAMHLTGAVDPAVAIWTDDARVDALVSAEGPQVKVADQYGAVTIVGLEDGVARIPLSGAVQFVSAVDGGAVSISPVEAFGDDVLSGLAVEASSTHPDTDAQVITSGTVNPYMAWRSGRLEGGRVDEDPSVTIELDQPREIERIAVASGSIVCCQAGLRAYSIDVRDENGRWRTVADVSDQFWDRVALISFDPMVATAVRVRVPWTTIRDIQVLDVNYTGFAGGLPPPFMGLQTESDYVVAIAAIQAWGPGDAP